MDKRWCRRQNKPLMSRKVNNLRKQKRSLLQLNQPKPWILMMNPSDIVTVDLIIVN